MKSSLFKSFKQACFEAGPQDPIWYDVATWFTLTDRQCSQLAIVLQWVDCISKQVTPEGCKFTTPAGVKIISRDPDCYGWLHDLDESEDLWERVEHVNNAFVKALDLAYGPMAWREGGGEQ